MDILLHVFKRMYVEFCEYDFFDLDNIAEFLTREHLASSSGYTGNEALKRSYSVSDDSRKSMKMQAKSYSELYRFLGWIASSDDKALKFKFTYFGLHVALSSNVSKRLFEQSLLGVEYPNHILDVKFCDVNKPFISMLMFADALGGKICRDEILLGPMNLSNAQNPDEITASVSKIQKLRDSGDLNCLNTAILELSQAQKMNPESVRNLTRFPLSALVYVGWFRKEELNIYGKSTRFLVLTDYGKQTIQYLKRAAITYGSNVEKLDPKSKSLFAKVAFLDILKNAHFDVSQDIRAFAPFKRNLYGDSSKPIVFSPFQYFTRTELEAILPEYSIATTRENKKADMLINDIAVDAGLRVERTSVNPSMHGNHDSDLKNYLLSIFSKHQNDIKKSTQFLLTQIERMKQQDFYPLTAELFSVIFAAKCFAPAAGNNNLRFDVVIEDENYTIPVEVKSPTEEKMLSVKAIRQALENKIILLARKPFPTNKEISSFAFGFHIPNKRSDVYQLIDDIYKTFQLNIAILDAETLISAAFYCLLTNKKFQPNSFKNVRGAINFEHENL